MNQMDSFPDNWLLLVHQLPPKPAYLRVKVWRRLQGIGAVALKGSVYVLPAHKQTLEDMQWVLKEIVAEGGEAMLCEAKFLDGFDRDEAEALFNTSRTADYRALADELQALGVSPSDEDAPTEIRRALAKARKRLGKLTEIDFFGAEGRDVVEGLLRALEARLEPTAPAASGVSDDDLRGRTWVTRAEVQVDRIACAWLIRRFVDPDARFKFVAAKGYAPQPGELRFDMFEAEFTHEGDRCSFETLLARTGLRDPGLKAIGEIIHDIDLKDGKFRREETAGVAHLLQGVAAPGRPDEDRIARGGALLDDLYAFFTAR